MLLVSPLITHRSPSNYYNPARYSSPTLSEEEAALEMTLRASLNPSLISKGIQDHSPKFLKESEILSED